MGSYECGVCGERASQPVCASCRQEARTIEFHRSEAIRIHERRLGRAIAQRERGILTAGEFAERVLTIATDMAGVLS